jgi:hypothetical protein
MPEDGLGSDAGRQSLTEVGDGGARLPTAEPAARGERLVALCALAVLAIAALFFVERIGGLRDAPAPPAFTPPTLDLRTLPIDPAAAQPLESPAQTGPASHAAPAPGVVRVHARPRPTSIAKTRKPPAKAVAKAAPVPAPIVLAMAEAWTIDADAPTRWERMHDEAAACADEDSFLDAVVCDQRVRHRYCDDWWGRADACPSGRTADYRN